MATMANSLSIATGFRVSGELTSQLCTAEDEPPAENISMHN